MALSFMFERHSRAPDSRFAHVTTSDHSAQIWVVALLSMIYAILVFAIRLGFMKWRKYSLDDVVVTIAHLVAFSMWGSLLTSLRNGLGTSYALLDDTEISRAQKYFFAGQILFYVALALSKCSILILLRAVFAQSSKVSIVAITTAALVAIWALTGVVVFAVACSAEGIVPKSGNEHCTSLVSWLRALAAGDVFTEMSIMVLPIIGFHQSLMSIKRKAVVVLAFSTRIPNIVFAVMHLLAYSTFISNHQPAISIVLTVVWQSVLLSYSLMSATTPLLKEFTKGFGTTGGSLKYFLRETTTTTTTTTTGGGSEAPRSYELSSLTKAKSGSRFPPLDATSSQMCADTVSWDAKPKSKMLREASKDIS